jgi:hypothetical protein
MFIDREDGKMSGFDFVAGKIMSKMKAVEYGALR